MGTRRDRGSAPVARPAFGPGVVTQQSLTRVPVALEEALRHLSLDLIGETSARPSNEARYVAIGLLLRPFKHGVQHASQQAWPVCDGDALPQGFLAEARHQIPLMCRVAHLPSPSSSCGCLNSIFLIRPVGRNGNARIES